MNIAATWGTAVGYMELLDSVVIETCDSRVAVVSKETFDYLYFRLSDFTAALKENCIRYIEDGDSVIIVNFMGDSMQMSQDKFNSYYDTLGECI